MKLGTRKQPQKYNGFSFRGQKISKAKQGPIRISGQVPVW